MSLEVPLVELIGCMFHFGHALFRNLCGFALKQEYTKNEELRSWFRRMQALAFVPLERLDDLVDEAEELFEGKVYERAAE